MGSFCTTIQANSDPAKTPDASSTTDNSVFALVGLQGASVDGGYNVTVSLNGEQVLTSKNRLHGYSTTTKANLFIVEGNLVVSKISHSSQVHCHSSVADGTLFPDDGHM